MGERTNLLLNENQRINVMLLDRLKEVESLQKKVLELLNENTHLKHTTEEMRRDNEKLSKAFLELTNKLDSRVDTGDVVRLTEKLKSIESHSLKHIADLENETVKLRRENDDLIRTQIVVILQISSAWRTGVRR
jgi:predicted nuclease with TOPRIM domain